MLFAGVVARYVFHAPLVWSDEVASILFLWLGMLGSALALSGKSHLRMTTVAARLRAGWRPHLDAFTLAVCATFLVLLLMPSWQYLTFQADTITATLGVSMVWRALAMPVGIGLMVAITLLQMGRQPARITLPSLAVVVLACAAFYLLRPYLVGLGRLNLVIFFLAGVPVLVFSGVPIAFSFGAATLGYIELAPHPGLRAGRAHGCGHGQSVLLSIPLFVFLGLLIEMTGMAEVIVDLPRQPARSRPRRAVITC